MRHGHALLCFPSHTRDAIYICCSFVDPDAGLLLSELCFVLDRSSKSQAKTSGSCHPTRPRARRLVRVCPEQVANQPRVRHVGGTHNALHLPRSYFFGRNIARAPSCPVQMQETEAPVRCVFPFAGQGETKAGKKDAIAQLGISLSLGSIG